MQLTRDDCLELLTDYPFEFARTLGFTDLTELHNSWIRQMLFCDYDFTLLAHRGSFKSTCLTISLAISMALEPNKNIILLRKTDIDVKETISQIYKIMNTDVFKYFIKTIHDVDLVFTTATAFALDTNLHDSTRGSCQIVGLGIKTSITGKHADLVITDDICNIKDRISKPERDVTKLTYMELQNIRNRGGRIINLGTPWHKDDVFKLMPNHIEYDCYSTGLISRDKLEEIRQSMTPSLFAANYELKHIADDDCLFSNPTFTKDTESIYNGLAHIDASYGGTDGTAFSILKKNGDDYVAFGMRWDKHVDDCLGIILPILQLYRAGTVYVETNADKGYLAKELRKNGLIVSEYKESTNKFIKISTYLRKEWENIKFLEDTSPDYLNEILDYNENASHDDSPDSLSCLVRCYNKGKWLF